jgi:hypothetical protein
MSEPGEKQGAAVSVRHSDSSGLLLSFTRMSIPKDIGTKGDQREFSGEGSTGLSLHIAKIDCDLISGFRVQNFNLSQQREAISEIVWGTRYDETFHLLLLPGTPSINDVSDLEFLEREDIHWGCPKTE